MAKEQKLQNMAMVETEEQQVERLAAELALLRATTTETEEQQAARLAAQLAFLKVGLEEYQRYNAMKNEGVVEECRGGRGSFTPTTQTRSRNTLLG